MFVFVNFKLSLNSKRNSAGETMVINSTNQNNNNEVVSSSSPLSTPSSPNIIAQNFESKTLAKTLSSSSSQPANTQNSNDNRKLSNNSSLPNGISVVQSSPIQDECLDDGSTTSSKDANLISSGQGLDSSTLTSDKNKHKKKGEFFLLHRIHIYRNEILMMKTRNYRLSFKPCRKFFMAAFNLIYLFVEKQQKVDEQSIDF